MQNKQFQLAGISIHEHLLPLYHMMGRTQAIISGNDRDKFEELVMREVLRFRKIIGLMTLQVAFLLSSCLQPKPTYVGYDKKPRRTEHKLAKKRQGDRGISAASAKKTPQIEGDKYSLSTSMVARNLATELRPFLNSPYKYGGESPAGVDCSGLVKRVFENGFNIFLPHKASYQYDLGQSILRPRLFAGDLVFFYGKNRRDIGHVGIYLGQNQFIHSMIRRGVVISNLDEGYWKKNYAGARRILGNIKPKRPAALK